MAKHLAAMLQSYKIVMLRGHGSFAIGQTLDEAFHWSSTLEESCQIALAVKAIGEPFLEYRGMSMVYNKIVDTGSLVHQPSPNVRPEIKRIAHD